MLFHVQMTVNLPPAMDVCSPGQIEGNRKSDVPGSAEPKEYGGIFGGSPAGMRM